MTTHQIYQDATNAVIELLETHLTNFERPWISLGVDNGLARNPITGKNYRNINPFLLSCEMMNKAYLKNEWATANQIKSMKGVVRKGEIPTIILPFLSSSKIHHVFNLHAQTENLPETYYALEPIPEISDFKKDVAVEGLIKSTEATIFEKEGSDAFYADRYDFITIPIREQFRIKTEAYHNVCLHEFGLWTGGKMRLNRKSKVDNGVADPIEHLTAELISAFCCANLGFSKTITSNTEHIKAWIALLKNDPKAIISAAASAQKGADLILENHR